MADIKYEIVKKVGVLSKSASGARPLLPVGHLPLKGKTPLQPSPVRKTYWLI
jgi:hypothetical protein